MSSGGNDDVLPAFVLVRHGCGLTSGRELILHRSTPVRMSKARMTPSEVASVQTSPPPVVGPPSLTESQVSASGTTMGSAITPNGTGQASERSRRFTAARVPNGGGLNGDSVSELRRRLRGMSACCPSMRRLCYRSRP